MLVPRINLWMVQLIVVVTALLCAVILRANWFIEDGWFLLLGTVAFQAYIAIHRPAWFAWLFGDRVYEEPFWPFRRWTWTTPPERWRKTVLSGLFLGLVVFPGAAVWFYYRKPGHPQWGFIALELLASPLLVISSIRLWARVRAVRAHPVAVERIV
jgi:hypothetical protein